jgi:hypothetical protein
MKPQPKTEPISEMFSGFSRDYSGHERSITELYFPSLFNRLECDVTSFKIELYGFRDIKIKTKFILRGRDESIYEDEYWKTRSISNFWRFSKEPETIKDKAPIFSIMLSKLLRVVSVKMSIDGEKRFVSFDQSSGILITPNSHPPLTKMEANNYYCYYNKKATIFYSNFCLNKEYYLEIDLDCSGTFDFSPFFPYRKVNFKNGIKEISCCDLAFNNSYDLVDPIKSKVFPDWLEYRLDKKTINDFKNPMRPIVIPANPWRGSIPVFNLEEKMNMVATKNPGLTDKEIALILSKRMMLRARKFVLERYSTIDVGFMITIPSTKDYDISIKTVSGPLPSRIYNQLAKIPGYDDLLVEYDILNLKKDSVNLKIETEIIGVTDKSVRNIILGGLHEKNDDKKSRIRFSEIPRMKIGILDNLVNPMKGTLSCIVTDTDSNTIIKEETREIQILPNDQMIFELRDVLSSRKYFLSDFICAWIYPNDKNGLFDKIRAGSSKYLPADVSHGIIKSNYDLEKHVEAIYKYLSLDEKIKYLNQPFSSLNLSDSQRIVLPDKVLNNKAGNCIDLCILFASLLEGYGIYSFIFLVPGHAFLGWDINGSPSIGRSVFLEATHVDDACDFGIASGDGEELFKKYFTYGYGDERTIIDCRDFTAEMRDSFMVDLKRARDNGIY